MNGMAFQITSLTIVYKSVYSGADQRKHQSPASLAFVRGIHRWLMNSRTKGQWRGKCFHLMTSSWLTYWWSRDKMVAIRRWHFQVQFLELNSLNIEKNFTEIYSLWSYSQYASTGSATNHYLKQYWYVLLKHICVMRPLCVRRKVLVMQPSLFDFKGNRSMITKCWRSVMGSSFSCPDALSWRESELI